jgi:hypothetical protein
MYAMKIYKKLHASMSPALTAYGYALISSALTAYGVFFVAESVLLSCLVGVTNPVFFLVGGVFSYIIKVGLISFFLRLWYDNIDYSKDFINNFYNSNNGAKNSLNSIISNKVGVFKILSLSFSKWVLASFRSVCEVALFSWSAGFVSYPLILAWGVTAFVRHYAHLGENVFVKNNFSMKGFAKLFSVRGSGIILGSGIMAASMLVPMWNYAVMIFGLNVMGPLFFGLCLLAGVDVLFRIIAEPLSSNWFLLGAKDSGWDKVDVKESLVGSLKNNFKKALEMPSFFLMVVLMLVSISSFAFNPELILVVATVLSYHALSVREQFLGLDGGYLNELKPKSSAELTFLCAVLSVFIPLIVYQSATPAICATILFARILSRLEGAFEQILKLMDVKSILSGENPNGTFVNNTVVNKNVRELVSLSVNKIKGIKESNKLEKGLVGFLAMLPVSVSPDTDICRRLVTVLKGDVWNEYTSLSDVLPNIKLKQYVQGLGVGDETANKILKTVFFALKKNQEIAEGFSNAARFVNADDLGEDKHPIIPERLLGEVVSKLSNSGLSFTQEQVKDSIRLVLGAVRDRQELSDDYGRVMALVEKGAESDETKLEDVVTTFPLTTVAMKLGAGDEVANKLPGIVFSLIKYNKDIVATVKAGVEQSREDHNEEKVGVAELLTFFMAPQLMGSSKSYSTAAMGVFPPLLCMLAVYLEVWQDKNVFMWCNLVTVAWVYCMYLKPNFDKGMGNGLKDMVKAYRSGFDIADPLTYSLAPNAARSLVEGGKYLLKKPSTTIVNVETTDVFEPRSRW